MESELLNILPAILKYSADKGYVQKKDVERAVSAIQPILDRETKKAIEHYHLQLRMQRQLLLDETNLNNRPESFRSGFISGMDELLSAGLKAQLTKKGKDV